MDHPSGERGAEDRERPTVAHVYEIAANVRHTETSVPEPTGVDFTRSSSCAAPFVIDLLQRFEDVRVGPESSEDFDECAKPTARRVEHPVDALRIVPAVA
jgi:hypothetical protein